MCRMFYCPIINRFGNIFQTRQNWLGVRLLGQVNLHQSLDPLLDSAKEIASAITRRDNMFNSENINHKRYDNITMVLTLSVGVRVGDSEGEGVPPSPCLPRSFTNSGSRCRVLSLLDPFIRPE